MVIMKVKQLIMRKYCRILFDYNIDDLIKCYYFNVDAEIVTMNNICEWKSVPKNK